MGWQVMPIQSTTVGQSPAVYGDGCYFLLNRGDVVPIYHRAQNRTSYLGLLGSVTLPGDFPPITFAEGIDQIVVVPVETP